MHRLLAHPCLRQRIAGLSVALLFTACVTVREPIPVTVLATGESRDFPHAIVLTRDSVAHDLLNVHIAGDSLTGAAAAPAGQRFRAPLAEVLSVETVERNVAGPVVAIGRFVLDTVVEFGRLMVTLTSCLFARC